MSIFNDKSFQLKKLGKKSKAYLNSVNKKIININGEINKSKNRHILEMIKTTVDPLKILIKFIKKSKNTNSWHQETRE